VLRHQSWVVVLLHLAAVHLHLGAVHHSNLQEARHADLVLQGSLEESPVWADSLLVDIQEARHQLAELRSTLQGSLAAVHHDLLVVDNSQVEGSLPWSLQVA
jgi:hypothetical protein